MVCLVWGGVPGPGGLASQHALRQTPSPPVDRHTPVKTLPWPNFVAPGNNEQTLYLLMEAEQEVDSVNRIIKPHSNQHWLIVNQIG